MLTKQEVEDRLTVLATTEQGYYIGEKLALETASSRTKAAEAWAKAAETAALAKAAGAAMWAAKAAWEEAWEVLTVRQRATGAALAAAEAAAWAAKAWADLDLIALAHKAVTGLCEI